MTSIKSNSAALLLLGVAAAGFTALPTAALAQSESGGADKATAAQDQNEKGVADETTSTSKDGAATLRRSS